MAKKDNGKKKTIFPSLTGAFRLARHTVPSSIEKLLLDHMVNRHTHAHTHTEALSAKNSEWCLIAAGTSTMGPMVAHRKTECPNRLTT